MPKQLTEKQKKILEFLINHIRRNGYPPSIRDVANKFDMSSKGAYDHIRAIEKKGYIKRDPSKPRAIEVPGLMPILSDIVEVPVLGKVSAGEPLFAQENIERTLILPRDIVKSDNAFALRVKGDSMIEAGIFENDFVIVRQQKHAEQGDIVVVLIGEEATVKRFYKEDDHIRLQPENPSMSPIIVKEAQILGKVIGLFREI